MQRFGDLLADRHHRVERRHRLLEDHRDLVAAHVAHLLLGELEQIAPSSRIEPATMRPGGSGISRISESAVMLLPQPDSPTIARVSPAATSKSTPSTALTMPWRVKNQAWPNVSRRLREKLASFDRTLPRIEDVAHGVAQQVGAEHREADGDAGKDHQPRRRAHVLGRRFREHAAPGRMRLRNAEAEEGQRRLGQDRRAELRGAEHDQRRQRVGQDVPDGDARSRSCRRPAPPRRRASRAATACSSG